MEELEGRVVLVTGGTRGVGRVLRPAQDPEASGSDSFPNAERRLADVRPAVDAGAE
jgi:hypothetical protein